MVSIDNLPLVFLTQFDSQRFQCLSIWHKMYAMAFQLVTLAMAVAPSCSYTLQSRSMTRKRDPNVRPLYKSWLLN
jgi:hypothetical protein